jgi:VanZ family protein
MFTCPSPETTSARTKFLEKYKESLQDVGTPDELVTYFLHGITTWTKMQQGELFRQIAPTVGDISKAVATAVYSEQTRLVGWEAFLRGRICQSWADVYKTYFSTADNTEITTWLSDVIRANLDLALALWHHRNGIVYGIDKAAARNKIILKLQRMVKMEYKSYESDPFIIPRSLSYLFESRSLHQRLQLDKDSLKCWLEEVREARLTQEETTRRAAEMARRFFLPRSLPTNPPVTDDDSSGGSTKTYDEEGDKDSITTATYDSLERVSTTLEEISLWSHA